MDMKPVNSSNVKEVGYDPATKTLAISFHSGGTYHYADVSPEKHAEMMAAKSIGGHFHKNIRDKHVTTKQGK